MVILSGGLKVWVEVAGKEAVEYGVQHTSQGKVNTTSCVIEAKQGQTFKVYYDNVPTEAKHQTRVELSIDGTALPGKVHCLHKPGESTKGKFKGYWEKKNKGKQDLRAFVFGKTQTTSEGSFQDLPKHLKAEGCTIKVEVKLRARGRYRHAKDKSKAEKTKDEAYTALCVHEDTKPALLGLLTKPGEVIGSSNFKGGGKCCYCVVEQEAKFHQIVSFQYLSHEWLIRGNYIKDPRGNALQQSDTKDAGPNHGLQLDADPLREKEAPNEDSSKQSVMSPSTQASLLKRRAGSEPLNAGPDSRMKAEHPVDSAVDPVVKVENGFSNVAAPRRIEVDATEEGEGYKVIGPSPEVVVISDDDD